MPRRTFSGVFGARKLPAIIPGMEPISRGNQQGGIDLADKEIAHAGDKGQRHGVGDVRTDDLHRRQLRVEQDQGRYAQRTGTDRRQRHQETQHQAGQDGQQGAAAGMQRLVLGKRLFLALLGQLADHPT